MEKQKNDNNKKIGMIMIKKGREGESARGKIYIILYTHKRKMSNAYTKNVNASALYDVCRYTMCLNIS